MTTHEEKARELTGELFDRTHPHYFGALDLIEKALLQAEQRGIERAADICRGIGDAARMADDTMKGWKLAEGAYQSEKAIRSMGEK